MSKNHPIKVLILLGPTAVGKTQALLEISSGLRKMDSQAEIEVINCDTVQIYRHLNIASAKPSAEVQEKLRHHLLDFLDPRESFSAARFVSSSDQLIRDIHSRARIPVISGGANFYINSFLYGLHDIPSTEGRYHEMLLQWTVDELGEALKKLDIESWKKIHSNDRQRLMRACEVSLETGKAFSQFHQNRSVRSEYDCLLISLSRPRAALYGRIDQRVVSMFFDGLEQEIEGLKSMGYTFSDHGLKSIGYREFFDPMYGSLSRGERMELIQRKSRNYAKRQITFMRSLPNVETYSTSDISHITDRIGRFFRPRKFS